MRSLCLLALLALGCDDDPTPTLSDAAPTDAAPVDAAEPDAAVADAEPDAALPAFEACTTHGPLDDTLRINHVQALGSHNSYHLRSAVVVDDHHDFDHPPLGEQLSLGVRQIELDLHWHVERGFEVFHLVAVDQASVCDRWVDCLADLRRWSAAHPCHTPIVVWVEAKDTPLDRANPNYDGFLDKLDVLEAELLSVWPREQLITPDDVRGEHPDLPTALAADGWPTLAEARGKLLVTLLDTGDYRDAYMGDNVTLAGRALFAKADDPAEPWAATFKIDDAASDADAVRARVEAGFLVTSNVNLSYHPLAERQADLDATLAAAPHHLATDYVVADAETGWVTALPEASPRCHPTAAPPECTTEAVEPR